MTESRYTSLLFNTTEYHHIGPFRFPIYKDLLPGEAKAIEATNRAHAKDSFQSLKLVRTIAKKRGIKPSEAVALLGKLGESDNNELVFEFADELEENQRTGVSLVEQQAAMVTVFMQYRAEASFPASPETWQKTTDWNERDTDMMPTKMMQEIVNFITWERDGWPKSGATEGNEPAPKETTTAA